MDNINIFSQRLKILLFLLFLLIINTSIFSQQAVAPDWKLLFTHPAVSVAQLELSKAASAEFPASFTAPVEGASVRGEGNCLWLITSFTPPAEWRNEDLIIDFDEVQGPAEFYLNGSKAGSIGKTGRDYFIQSGIHADFQLPAGSLKAGENLLILKLYSDSENFNIQKPYIGIYEEHINDIWRLSFLNGQIFFGFAILVLFIGLYYLSLFLFNKKERINLYFSLANIFLSIYFAQMGLPFRTVPVVILLVVAKYSLFLYFTFLTLFFIEFFNIFNRKPVKIAAAALAAVIGILYITNSGSYSEIMGVFDTALLPGGAELLLMLFIAAFSMIKGNRDAVPVFIGVVIGIAAAVYDFYFALSGKEPAFWLQGFGILLFNICMFEMLSLRTIRADRLLKSSSKQIEENAAVMKDFLHKVETVSLSVAEMSAELDREIEASASSVEEFVSGTDVIASIAGEQLNNVEDTGLSLKQLLSSSEQINEQLGKQHVDVRETSMLITEMLDNISEITGSLKKTSDFTGELGELTQKGEQSVKRSAATVEAIQQDSKNIYQILSSITDISAQTNLLAMNAAIEAAHAGKAGAGFAVVAGEIRSLAMNTASRTKETVEQIDTIVSRIKEAYDANAEVQELLSRISDSTRIAVEQVKSAYLAVEEQRAASQAVQNSVDSLQTASAAIKVQTESQQEMSTEMESKQGTLRELSERVSSSIEKMSKANGKIQATLEKVRLISNGSRSEAEKLKELVTDSE